MYQVQWGFAALQINVIVMIRGTIFYDVGNYSGGVTETKLGPRFDL